MNKIIKYINIILIIWLILIVGINVINQDKINNINDLTFINNNYDVVNRNYASNSVEENKDNIFMQNDTISVNNKIKLYALSEGSEVIINNIVYTIDDYITVEAGSEVFVKTGIVQIHPEK